MRIFALSDLHIDYDVNAKWVDGVSRYEFQDDVLILAGDLTDRIKLLDWCLSELVKKFKKVLFVPGNHELWVIRDAEGWDSLGKFEEVRRVVESAGALLQSYSERGTRIFPLLGWYDFSFGMPSERLKEMWMDFRACKWPRGYSVEAIASYFQAMNEDAIQQNRDGGVAEKTITFSHFMPRIDLMPWYIPEDKRTLYPVLGSKNLDCQLRKLDSSVHVYGHSHVNRDMEIDGVRYVNNAFGYPNETAIASKRLTCIHEC